MRRRRQTEMDLISIERVQEYMRLQPERAALQATQSSSDVKEPMTPPPRPPRLARQGSATDKGRVTVHGLRFRYVRIPLTLTQRHAVTAVPWRRAGMRPICQRCCTG